MSGKSTLLRSIGLTRRLRRQELHLRHAAAFASIRSPEQHPGAGLAGIGVVVLAALARLKESSTRWTSAGRG
jgi:hypothetical protein